jgi:cell division protein FtsB
LNDSALSAAVALGALIVLVAAGGAAIIVAVVLRHRDVADLKAEAARTEAAAQRHAMLMDEMGHLKSLTIRAIGGREALEAAVKELAERIRAHGGRLEDHSGSISALRERLGMKDGNGGST